MVTISGAKVAYSFSWVLNVVGGVADSLSVIDKYRHIKLYHERDDKMEDDSDEDSDDDSTLEYDENPKEKTKFEWVKEKVIRYFTDPFLDMTISERASKLRKYVKFLRKQLQKTEKNQIIHLFLNQ